MNTEQALSALAALAQSTRLDVFRLLVRAGSSGMFAGAIAETLDVRQNTLSTNLALLTEAGLISRCREGRQIRYCARLDGMSDLIAFLTEDCCADTEICDIPAIDCAVAAEEKTIC